MQPSRPLPTFRTAKLSVRRETRDRISSGNSGQIWRSSRKRRAACRALCSAGERLRRGMQPKAVAEGVGTERRWRQGVPKNRLLELLYVQEAPEAFLLTHSEL